MLVTTLIWHIQIPNANVATGEAVRDLAEQRAVELPKLDLREAIVGGAMGHGTAADATAATATPGASSRLCVCATTRFP